ncbi:hypothetical protein HG530_009654 [Fusarium avenaceum]|nr:hypothetical protein HG530_009654 [Fusarium avenaceum]
MRASLGSALPVAEIEILDADFFLERLSLLIHELLFLLLFAALIIASDVFSITSLENLDDDTDDHGEPSDGDHLEEEEGSKETPLDSLVVTNKTLGVDEGLGKVSPASWRINGADHVIVVSLEATIGHDPGGVGVN